MSERRKTVWCRSHYTWGDRLKQLFWGIVGSLLATLVAKCVAGPVDLVQEVLRRKGGCHTCSGQRLGGPNRSRQRKTPMTPGEMRRPHRHPPFGEGGAGRIP